LILFYYVKS